MKAKQVTALVALIVIAGGAVAYGGYRVGEAHAASAAVPVLTQKPIVTHGITDPEGPTAWARPTCPKGDDNHVVWANGTGVGKNTPVKTTAKFNQTSGMTDSLTLALHGKAIDEVIPVTTVPRGVGKGASAHGYWAQYVYKNPAHTSKVRIAAPKDGFGFAATDTFMVCST